MHESILARGTSKKDLYQSLLDPISELLTSESDFIANMANLSAVLKESMRFFWVGFYIVKGGELVLGPFQGTLACTRIHYGEGVCGSSWKQKSPIIVDDVDLFPGHIACSSLSKSEIVIPLIADNEVWAVLDVDSDQLKNFDSIDLEFLKQLISYIRKSV